MATQAFEFHYDATIEELCDRLNQLGPWEWMLRDSHWYGDYLYTAPAGNVRVRVLEPMDRAGPPYTIQVNHKGGDAPSLASVVAIAEELLAKLGAENVQSTEPVWD